MNVLLQRSCCRRRRRYVWHNNKNNNNNKYWLYCCYYRISRTVITITTIVMSAMFLSQKISKQSYYRWNVASFTSSSFSSSPSLPPSIRIRNISDRTTTSKAGVRRRRRSCNSHGNVDTKPYLSLFLQSSVPRTRTFVSNPKMIVSSSDDELNVSNEKNSILTDGEYDEQHDTSQSQAMTILHPSNVISSTQSLTVKKVQALIKNRNKRIDHQQVIVEGPRMIKDLFRHCQTRKYISTLLVDIELYDQYMLEFQQLLSSSSSSNMDTNTNTIAIPQQQQQLLLQQSSSSNLYNHNIMIHPTDRKVMESCCTDTVTQQGIVAICNIPPLQKNNQKKNVDMFQKLKQAQRQNYVSTLTTTSSILPSQSLLPPPRDMYLICDGIQDPGNIGTLIRTAVACNISAIILLPKNCDVWNPKAIRSAMGTTFMIPIIEMKHWKECYAFLQNVGCTSSTIYAATMLDNDQPDHDNDDGNKLRTEHVVNQRPSSSTAYFDVNWVDPTTTIREEYSSSSSGPSITTTPIAAAATGSALIIGSEGNGLTQDVRDAIQDQQIQTVFVPMIAIVESLNAAICGSIILFEYVRQKTLYMKR